MRLLLLSGSLSFKLESNWRSEICIDFNTIDEFFRALRPGLPLPFLTGVDFSRAFLVAFFGPFLAGFLTTVT